LRPTICNRPTSVSPITAFDPGSARGSRIATSKQRSSTWCCRVPAGSSSNEDILEVAPLDAFRVAPKVLRTWEAGPDGLEVLAFGARVEGDWQDPLRSVRRV